METKDSAANTTDVRASTSGYLVEVHPQNRIVVLNPSGTTVGRDGTTEPVDVALDDARVSKRHARVYFDAPGFVASDMGSKNGLRVDGGYIAPRASGHLIDGSVLRIGGSLFVFRHGAPPTVPWEHGAVPGLAPAVLAVRNRLELLARDDCIVLILGPTGTGKEFVARWLHEARKLPPEKLVAVNCGSLQRSFARVELFGAEKGAYTDAREARAGLVARADGGTLFLDELGELELEVQPELLRFLEDGSYRPLGRAGADLRSRTRVIAATHVTLDVEVQAGRFRRDLLARFKSAGAPVVLPGLAERREDLLAWARMLIGGDSPRWSAGFAECLLLYDWPDNLRELRGILRTARREARDPAELRSADLPPALVQRRQALRGPVASPVAESPVEPPAPDDLIAEKVVRVLTETGGNMKRSAEILGIDRRRLYRLCEMWGLDPAKYRTAGQCEPEEPEL